MANRNAYTRLRPTGSHIFRLEEILREVVKVLLRRLARDLAAIYRVYVGQLKTKLSLKKDTLCVFGTKELFLKRSSSKHRLLCSSQTLNKERMSLKKIKRNGENTTEILS